MTLIEERPAPTAGPAVDLPDRELSARWAVVLTGAWVTIFTLGMVVEPASTGEESYPLVVTTLALVLLSSWAVMASGFLMGRRYGAMASAVGAACLVAMAIGCPLSGHHAGIGPWWAVQLVGSFTLVGLSGAALRSS